MSLMGEFAILKKELGIDIHGILYNVLINGKSIALRI